MKGFLLVALLMAGCVLIAAKIDKTIHSQPLTPSANLNPSKPVIVELKRTRQASFLEPSILISAPPTESEHPTQNPQKNNKLTKETKTLTETKPARMEPTKPTAEVPAKPADVPAKPEEVPVKPEEILVKPEEVQAKSEEVPVKPEEILVKAEDVLAKSEEVLVKPKEVLVKPEVAVAKPKEVPVTPEMPVETVRDDTEVPVSPPFGQKPSENTKYPLPEGVTLSPRHGDTPEDFIRDELVIPGGSAGNSNEQYGDVAELSIVYTVENNPDEDPNITRAHRSQPVAFGNSEDHATCPAPKTAK